MTTVNKIDDSGELKVSAYQVVATRIDTMNQSKLEQISGKYEMSKVSALTPVLTKKVRRKRDVKKSARGIKKYVD